jgi:hypothetical protein
MPNELADLEFSVGSVNPSTARRRNDNDFDQSRYADSLAVLLSAARLRLVWFQTGTSITTRWRIA